MDLYHHWAAQRSFQSSEVETVGADRSVHETQFTHSASQQHRLQKATKSNLWLVPTLSPCPGHRVPHPGVPWTPAELGTTPIKYPHWSLQYSNPFLYSCGDFLSVQITPQHVWTSQALESKILNKHSWNF